MTDGEQLNWIRLARTVGIGPVSFFQLLQRFKSAGQRSKLCPASPAGPAGLCRWVRLLSRILR